MLCFLIQPALTPPDIQNLTGLSFSLSDGPLSELFRELRAHAYLAVGSETDSRQTRLQSLHEPWSLGGYRVSTFSQPTLVCQPSGGSRRWTR